MTSEMQKNFQIWWETPINGTFSNMSREEIYKKLVESAWSASTAEFSRLESALRESQNLIDKLGIENIKLRAFILQLRQVIAERDSLREQLATVRNEVLREARNACIKIAALPNRDNHDRAYSNGANACADAINNLALIRKPEGKE